MKVKFKNIYPNEFQITEKENCQLLVAMQGNKEYIKRKLQCLLAECEDSYAKPRQGTISECGGIISVITPFWNGKEH